MAARLRKRHQDDVRTKIQTSQIINRLQNHVFDVPEKDDDGNPIETGNFLHPTQITAAVALLKKTLPDLSSTELTGDPNKPLNMALNIVGVQTKK